MTDTAPAAASSSAAAPQWFQELRQSIAPSAPAPEPVPDPPAPEAPASTDAPAPVATAEPAAETPTETTPPPVETTPDPETEALRRQVAEMNERWERVEAERRQERQAAAERERETRRTEYWQEVRNNASQIDDDDQRVAYYQRAAEDLARQESEAQRQLDIEHAAREGVRSFPDHIGQKYGLRPEQIAYLRSLADNPNPILAGTQMAHAATAFRHINSQPTSQAAKEQAMEAFANRAAAEVADTGAVVTGSATNASPAPIEPPSRPQNLRPGSRESMSMLGAILFNNNNPSS